MGIGREGEEYRKGRTKNEAAQRYGFLRCRYILRCISFSNIVEDDRLKRCTHNAMFNIEHERGKTMEEVEFQFKWKVG